METPSPLVLCVLYHSLAEVRRAHAFCLVYVVIPAPKTLPYPFLGFLPALTVWKPKPLWLYHCLAEVREASVNQRGYIFIIAA